MYFDMLISLVIGVRLCVGGGRFGVVEVWCILFVLRFVFIGWIGGLDIVVWGLLVLVVMIWFLLLWV